MRCILHAVAIDGFYGSNMEMVKETLQNALTEAARRGAHTVALPALATGYGPLTMTEFARALAMAIQREYPPVQEIRLVLRRSEDVETVMAILPSPPETRT